MGSGRTALACAGLLGVSCSPTCEHARAGTGDQIGELGNGEFVHGCLDRTDVACRIGEAPDCIVLDGRFELFYQLLDPSAISSDDIDTVLQVVPANEDFLGGRQPFVAQRLGRTAVLVREGGHIIDLMHLDVVRPHDIEIVSEAGITIDDRLLLAHGESIMLFVHPRADGCVVPGGALPLSTRGSPGLTRSIVRTTTTDVLELQGSAVGTVTLEVLLGDLERVLTIDVVEGPPPQTSTSENPTTGTETSTVTGEATDGASSTATTGG